ncbi:HD-GYP domain-containing protein [Butyrivibrio sp. VCD2006]|uniref:HD-GYP domain-containing protein n=1 Tax=Butyrivibrio sp. VCD2006 TaxID=1280664 RepID=UPI0018CA6916|nr:HD domain-containing phosphohydrolase [Butyrivibrio sp. VCD2006]
MSKRSPGINKNWIMCVSLVLLGILINGCLYFTMYSLNIPLYLDTVATIAMTLIAGPFFGIVTAVGSNFLCIFFDPNALYFSSINALVAIHTASFFRKHSTKKFRDVALYIMSVAAFVGIISTIIQWILTGIQTENVIESAAYDFSQATGFPYLVAVPILSILLNIVDKGLSAILALLILRLIPEEIKEKIQEYTVRQSRITEEEIAEIREQKKDIKVSVRSRETTRLLITSLLIILIMSWTGLRLFFNNSRIDETESAMKTAKLASDVIEAFMIPTFVREGEIAPGYLDTKELLYKIRDSGSGVTYLYVAVITEEGYQFVFDLDTEDEVGYEPGRMVPFGEEIKPYVPALLEGQEIEPIEQEEYTHRVQSVYYPVRTSDGRTMAYVVCDVALDSIASYMTDFVVRVLLIMAGIFILIVAYEMWMTSVYITYPISSLTACVDEFAESGDDQKALDDNVRKIRALDIQTDDEVERLYQTLCKMTLNQAEQMRNIRHLSESTVQMQDGLIVTMADMVESRDSDTGAHVQKTAAYVKIIVEGLKRKGYYAEKITPKFISDIVRSAPLHDVGKIKIPDEILNKPGRLTDEEFEVMKTHTIEGKAIIEKAINTVKGGSYLKEARNMAAYHHERWDGKGYPEGLHGEVIPLSARIMAVADVFDALVSPRVYKPAFPLEQAIEILQEGAGTQFDAKCIEVFLESLPEVKVILNKYHDSSNA